MGEGWTGGASDIVKAESSGEDPRATRGLVSNLPHPQVNKTKQHTHNSLSSFWIFDCIPRVLVLKQTQKLHEIIEDILEKVWTVCVECNVLDFHLDHRLRKKHNWQLGCHGWTVDNFYVCIKIILPKFHLNGPLSYPFSPTSKFYEWLRIKCDKCNMQQPADSVIVTFVRFVHWCES